MKNKVYVTIKAIILTLAIIIPLLVAFLMCRYTYKRHIDNYEGTYFANVKYDKKGNDKKNYKEQIEGLLQYKSYKYRLFDSKEIKYDDSRTLATLDIYEVIEKVEDEENSGTYHFDIYYYFLLHDVNYASMYRLDEGSEDAVVPSTGAIPSVYMQVRDASDYDNDDESLSFEFNADDVLNYVFIDYGASPAKVGKQYILALKIASSSLPSNHISVSIHCDTAKAVNRTSEPDEAKARYAYTKDNYLAIDYFYVDLTEAELSAFTVGYNNDAKAAGYTNYIFKTYWWWEALLTIVLVGALTGIFYMVLTYSDPDEKQ